MQPELSTRDVVVSISSTVHATLEVFRCFSSKKKAIQNWNQNLSHASIPLNYTTTLNFTVYGAFLSDTS